MVVKPERMVPVNLVDPVFVVSQGVVEPVVAVEKEIADYN